MKSFSRRHGLALLASLLGIAFAPAAQAQVFDAPQFFVLPPLNPIIGDGNGIPVTLNAGEIDASILTDIGGLPLNDVAIMTVAEQDFPAGTDFGGEGRVYSLVHTSGSDTQALALASPVDVPIDSEGACYIFPSSVQILPLDGDDVNDLAFISNCNGIGAGPGGGVGTIFGIQGAASDPFQVADSLTELGSQSGGIFIPPFVIGFGGQLELVSGDFDNDGRSDLAFYDFNAEDPQDRLHTLLNDGTLGTLPGLLSPVDGPQTPPNGPGGVLTISGDFDGDGNLDLAVAYLQEAGTNGLQIYQGNGDGTFAQSPMAQAAISSGDTLPNGLAAGDFDGNGFSDFAVGFVDSGLSSSAIAIILCSPGSPATCSAQTPIPIGSGSLEAISGTIVTGDFNSDGLDDLVNTFTQLEAPSSQVSNVQVRLNTGSGFNAAPDQTLSLDNTGFTTSLILQVVAKDIDACGGPDLAYTGASANIQPEGGDGEIEVVGPITSGDDVIDFELQAAVAFNPNEAPVANAGNPTSVSGGIQVGGVPGGQPTCSDPTDDVMVISWTVVFGNATFNDASASNPIVTSASANAVVQVTCTDACGLSDSATVTLPASNFIQGSCGTSLTGTMSAGFNATWLAIPALTGILALVRRRRS